MRVGTLVVDIAANLARLEKDMREGKGIVERNMRDMQRSVTSLKSAVQGVFIGTGAAMWTREIVQATIEAEQSGNRMRAVLRATGHQAGLTKRDLDELAESMQDALGFDDESIRNAQSQLLKFGNIHGQVFRDALKVSADLAAFMSTDMPAAAQLVGRTLQSPTEGLRMMEREFGKLTEAEEAHITKLADQGRALEAQQAVIELFRKKIGGTAEEMNSGLTQATRDVTNAWGDMLEEWGKTETVGGRLRSMLVGVRDILRDIQGLAAGGGSTAARDQLLGLSNINSTIETLERNLRERRSQRRAWGGGSAPDDPEWARIQARIDALKAQRGGLMGTMRAQGDQAAFESSLAASPAGAIALGGRTTDEEAAKAAARAAEAARKAMADAVKAGHENALAWAEAEQTIERMQREGGDTFREALIAPMVEAAQEAVDLAESLEYGWDEFGNRVVRTRQEFAEMSAVERAANDRAFDAQIEQIRKVQAAADRNREVLAQSITDGIMQGFDRGESFFENFANRMRSAVLTITVQPVVLGVSQAVSAPFASIAQSGTSSLLSSLGLSAGGAAGYGVATGGLTSSALAGEAAALGIGEVGAAAAIPGWGWALAGGALLASSLGVFGDKDGPAQRTSGYVAGFGEAGNYPWLGNRWFSDAEMGASLGQFQSTISTQEQNLIRNLGLSPDDVARVNAGLAPLAGKTYGFGTEHTDWTQSGAAQQIQADRLAVISRTLGRSIDELSKVMSLSAEQFAEALEDLERRAADAEHSLARHMRGLSGELGITALQDYRDSLAVSEYRSPLERIASARGIFESQLELARGGDLEAVRGFPQVAQSLLSIGRDVYASGPEFQQLFREANTALAEVLEQQQALQADILRDVPLTIMEASRDQIAEIRQQTADIVESLDSVRRELQALQAA
jgi:hypothetical protein